jgi:hypothetical protein
MSENMRKESSFRMTIWRNYKYNHTHCILNGIIPYYQEMPVCMRGVDFDRLFFGGALEDRIGHEEAIPMVESISLTYLEVAVP